MGIRVHQTEDIFADTYDAIDQMVEWRAGQPAVMPADPGAFLARFLPLLVSYLLLISFAPLRLIPLIQFAFELDFLLVDGLPALAGN